MTGIYETYALEGEKPERALSRLSGAVCIYNVKKESKNRILFTVKGKDSEKVFAIYPKVCYNNSVYGAPYVVRELKKRETFSEFFRRRAGFIVGMILLISVTTVSEKFLFKVKIVGATEYGSEIAEVLERHGVRKNGIYDASEERAIETELLSLSGVSFCSVKKTGTVLTVEIRKSALYVQKAKSGEKERTEGNDGKR